MTTVTIRPGVRTQIRGLPWTGKPADNYAVLEDCIGATRRGQVLYANGNFSVARSHTQALVSGLAKRFGRVHVIQYGGTEMCVEACWNANPETVGLCECSCAGANRFYACPRHIDRAKGLGRNSAQHRTDI
jgi:hypothetical protein